jgi:hypothetical protein
MRKKTASLKTGKAKNRRTRRRNAPRGKKTKTAEADDGSGQDETQEEVFVPVKKLPPYRSYLWGDSE